MECAYLHSWREEDDGSDMMVVAVMMVMVTIRSRSDFRWSRLPARFVCVCVRACGCMRERDVRAGCVPNAPVTLSLRTNHKWECVLLF